MRHRLISSMAVLASVLLLSGPLSHAAASERLLILDRDTVFVVNTTDDTDDGTCNAAHCSLREALAAASGHGPDTVTFDIPTSDPGYQPSTSTWTIQPTGGYFVRSETTVDGTLTTASAAEAGGARPGIEIDGTTLAQKGITGLRTRESVTLRGLVVNHFQYGIWVDGAGVTVEGCYVGTDATGTSAKPNGLDGILLADGATGALIRDNVLSGNGSRGIRLFGARTTGNTLRGNHVGTNAAGTQALPNSGAGIQLQAGAHDNIVEQNLISGNGDIGIHVVDSGTDGNVVRDNRIGVDSGGGPLPNGRFGVAFYDGPSHNVVGPDNVVAYNTSDGVLVDGAFSATGTMGNTITTNRISENGHKGIWLFRGGNGNLSPPAITASGGFQVSGTACPGCTVELFSDTTDEGAIYEGTTMANGAGSWTFSKMSGLTGPYVTATSTDGQGNTSEFSIAVSIASPPTATPTATRPSASRPYLPLVLTGRW